MIAAAAYWLNGRTNVRHLDAACPRLARAAKAIAFRPGDPVIGRPCATCWAKP